MCVRRCREVLAGEFDAGTETNNCSASSVYNTESALHTGAHRTKAFSTAKQRKKKKKKKKKKKNCSSNREQNALKAVLHHCELRGTAVT